MSAHANEMKIRTSQKKLLRQFQVVFLCLNKKNKQEEVVSILLWSCQIRCIFEMKSLDACGRRGALLSFISNFAAEAAN